MRSEFSRCENAVETPIGMILVLTIMTTAIAGIYAVGVPLIRDAQHNVRIQSMQNDFKILQADVNELKGPLPGEGPSRITTLNMGGGSITVMPDAPTTKIQVNYVNDTSDYYVFDDPLDVGNIKYALRDDTIIYENGAVITKYAVGEIMISRPNMFITPSIGNNITVMLHMIKFSGSLSSVGGGVTSVYSRFMEFDNSSDFKNKPVATTLYQNVNITITSEYYQAWANFFENELKNAGLSSPSQYKITQYPTTKQVVINIYGKTAGDDIYLSVHETIIRSSVS
ncbi:MAG: hypothetical protein QMC77_03445 [Methanocellales archaeon]|nr:hypothetical protein [Methanocellales archaeon]